MNQTHTLIKLMNPNSGWIHIKHWSNWRILFTNQTVHESTKTKNSYYQQEDGDIDKKKVEIRWLYQQLFTPNTEFILTATRGQIEQQRNKVITVGRMTNDGRWSKGTARIAWIFQQARERAPKAPANLEAGTGVSLEDAGIFTAEQDHRPCWEWRVRPGRKVSSRTYMRWGELRRRAHVSRILCLTQWP